MPTDSPFSPSSKTDPSAELSALLHPLPAGMRDLLPGDAQARANLTETVMGSFSLHGYEPVLLPAFEYAQVLEQGLAQGEGDHLLRFVEPETGEVVALRSDMTPQVARLVNTRLRDAPEPIRLSYQGSVLRRRHERARNNRQVPQAGIELIGVEGQGGDLEILEVAVAAARAAGLDRFVLDLAQPGIVKTLVSGVPSGTRRALIEALSLKHAGLVAQIADAAGLEPAVRRAIEALPLLHGGPEIWDRAENALRGTDAAPQCAAFRHLYQALEKRTEGVQLSIDLGEVWRFNYYTGPFFQLLAPGPGLPIGAGGRYDAFYARFGRGRPAAGFALDLDNLAWALSEKEAAHSGVARILVQGSEQEQQALLAGLRQLGIVAAAAPKEPLAYARAWRYSAVVELDGEGATVTDVEHGTQERLTDGAQSIAEQVEKRFAQATRK